MKIREVIVKLVDTTYQRVFNQKMSQAERDFLYNLSWVGAGTFVSTVLIAFFSILGGRLLGPQEYGKFTLIQSVAAFLSIPMSMGFSSAMLKYTAEKSDPNRQKNIISTTYIIIGSLILISVTCMFFFAQPLSKIFSTTPELLRFSIYFAVLSTFFGLAQTTLRSTNRMRAFALSQPAYAIILLISFVLFSLLDNLTFKSMVYSQLIAFAFAAIAIHLLYTRRYLNFSFDTTWTRTLSRFALATIIGIVAVAIYGNIGKIIIVRYMTVTDVGIYGAYTTATTSVASVLWSIFNMVFFPTASRYRDKLPILQRINRLVPFILVLGIPLVAISGRLILLLYGESYPFNLLWLILFATSAIISIIRGFYASLLSSEGPRGALLSSAAAVVTAFFSLALNLILVPAIGITGATIATITGYIAGIIALLWRGMRYLKNSLSYSDSLSSK